ncbi:hypothetical protein FRC05_004684 [Tulasnella sp. 425]|nr:hypothetical protein FRC05_004684 [Tulasnella sp. 425]
MNVPGGRIRALIHIPHHGSPANTRKQNDALESKLHVLPHVYFLIFNIIEPAMTTAAAVMAIGTSDWYYNETLPSDGKPAAGLTLRAQLIVRQLGNCYFLLGLISLCVFSAIRGAVPNNPAAQEKLVGGLLTALAIADLTHVGLSVLGMPLDLVFQPSRWNGIVHGNITVTIGLFLCRMAWFAGIRRNSYYYKVQGAKLKET